MLSRPTGRERTWPTSRVRFEGDGKAVAYWDMYSRTNLVMIDEKIDDLDSFQPLWPDWSVRVDELEAELADLVPMQHGA